MSEDIKQAMHEPSPHIIEMVEGLLEDAKAGKVVAVAFAGVYTNAQSFNTFIGDYYPMHLIGELRVLERDVVDCCVDTRRKVRWEFTE